jgi:formylglycine-generating enzyme
MQVEFMRRPRTGIVAWVVAAGLTASCSSPSATTVAPSGNDGGNQDATTKCGGSDEPCCEGTACNSGLTCGGGTCNAKCGGSGEPCCDGTACNVGLTCSGKTCAASNHADASARDAAQDSAGHVDDDAEAGEAMMPPASCAPGGAGMTNCGAGGSGSESCCTSLKVTGGTYYRTYTNTGTGPTGEADPATVSDFRLDKYLVTVGRFRQFVAAWNNGAGYMPANGSGKHTHLNGGQGIENSGDPGTYETGWDAVDWNNTTDIDPTNANLALCSPDSTWTDTSSGQENLPITCVNWWESYAFCIWDGGFLPSEAEWEYAAAGGIQQREYPWGSTDPGITNQYAIYGNGVGSCNYPGGSGSCTGVTNIAPVGYTSLGTGNWGQFDLAGEVFEWNLDWYSNSGSYADPCTDCAYLMAASWRVLRGGGFGYPTSALLPTYRFEVDPSVRLAYFGFRCARTP